jgi:regulator of sigma E protease
LSETLSKLLSADNLLIGTFLPFLIILTIVVFVHEMGHYLVGRWCGIGVKAFSIGFGPEIFALTDKRGTRWRFALIPLGGYVKFVGDMSGAGQVDKAAMDQMSEIDKKRSFHTQALWKRALTVFAGPFANFILTVVIFSVFISMNGKFISDPIIETIMPDSAAQTAGFKEGDLFVSLNDKPIVVFGDVQKYISRNPDQEITFKIKRDGEEQIIKATPTRTEIKDPLGNTITMPLLGVKISTDKENFRKITFSPLEAVSQAVYDSVQIMADTGLFVTRLVKGREDKCQLGGPIKIAKITGQASQKGIDWLIHLIAMLSIGVGFLNLLPIPPLDGGHLVLYGIEAVVRRPVSAKVQDWVFRIGTGLVLSFTAFVFLNDLFAC